MKDYPKAREILVTGGLNNRLLNEDYNNCIDWLEDVFRVLDNKANNWNDRNNKVFKGKMDEVVMVWESAQILSKDFKI
ncbi:reverse transcriptase [Gossypium australe]|uniref:Reverse transcriptase n=1 Tax=Gossypium australe TaxID=47621 RepID=A0A5B6UXK2_9ROSI|nr:reverse transcriptase [Gossypium australe]